MKAELAVTMVPGDGISGRDQRVPPRALISASAVRESPSCRRSVRLGGAAVARHRRQRDRLAVPYEQPGAMGVAILVAEIMDVDARDGLVIDLVAARASQKPAPVDDDAAGAPVEGDPRLR